MIKFIQKIVSIISGEEARKRAEKLAEQQRAAEEAAKREARKEVRRRAQAAKIERTRLEERARFDDLAARAQINDYVKMVRSCDIGKTSTKCATCKKPAMAGEIYCYHCMPI